MNRYLAALLVFTFSINAFALRCDNGLVLDGDSTAEVILKCGSPDATSSDVWKDRTVFTYKQGDALNIVQFLNDKVVNIEFKRL